MNAYLDIYIKHEKAMLKINKTSLRTFSLILIINIIIAIFDYYTGLKPETFLGQIATGAMIVNIFWLIGFVAEAYTDYKHSKKMIHFYEEQEGNAKLEDAYSMSQKSRQLYEKKLYEMEQKLKVHKAND